MKTYDYKGYTIKKYTNKDWVIFDSKGQMRSEAGRIPKTLKEAKRHIDEIQEETK